MVGAPAGGGGVLPWMAYSGICRWTGYGVLPPTPTSAGCCHACNYYRCTGGKRQNFTRQHNAITQRRHVFGNNHDILMNPFYIWFEISSTTSNQRQPWKLLDLQEIIIIKKHLVLKDQCQYNQLLLGRTPLGWLLCVCLREMNAL